MLELQCRKKYILENKFHKIFAKKYVDDDN